MISSSLFKKRKNLLLLFLLVILFVPVLVFFSYQRSKINTRSNAQVIQQQDSLGAKTMKISTSPTTSQQPTAFVTSAPNPSHSVYLGMWTEGFWDESSYTLHPEKLTQLQGLIGKKVAIAHYYRGWENLGKPSIVTELQTIRDNGWRPMLSSNPYFFAECQQNGKNLYKTIAGGGCDSFLQKIGSNLKQYGKPLFLRFAWEMNIDSIDWSTQKTTSSPADFVQAWRRFHDIIASEGATNVIWVWSPNVITPTSIPYASLYPGNSYVDWIGLDGYNWGKTQSWSNWQSFSQVFLQSYSSITSLAPTKPLMIAEVNTTDVGGDKPVWYQDMLATQIPNNFPKVKAVLFYNETRMKQENVNWLINVTPASLQSFMENIQNPMYLSSF